MGILSISIVGPAVCQCVASLRTSTWVLTFFREKYRHNSEPRLDCDALKFREILIIKNITHGKYRTGPDLLTCE